MSILSIVMVAGAALFAALVIFCFSTWVSAHGLKRGTKEFINAIFNGM